MSSDRSNEIILDTRFFNGTMDKSLSNSMLVRLKIADIYKSKAYTFAKEVETSDYNFGSSRFGTCSNNYISLKLFYEYFSIRSVFSFPKFTDWGKPLYIHCIQDNIDDQSYKDSIKKALTNLIKIISATVETKADE